MPSRNTHPEGAADPRPRSLPHVEPLADERSRPPGDLFLAAIRGDMTQEQRQRLTEAAVARSLNTLDHVTRESSETKAAASAALVQSTAAANGVAAMSEQIGAVLAELGQRAKVDSLHDEEITKTRTAVTEVTTTVTETRKDLDATKADLALAKAKVFGARATAAGVGFGAVKAIEHLWPLIFGG